MKGLKSAGSSLLGVFGGPWGAAFTVAVMGVAGLTSAMAERTALHEKYRQSLDDIGTAADEMSGKLTRAAQSTLTSKLNQAKAELERTKQDIDRLKEELKGMDLGYGEWSGSYRILSSASEKFFGANPGTWEAAKVLDSYSKGLTDAYQAQKQLLELQAQFGRTEAIVEASTRIDELANATRKAVKEEESVATLNQRLNETGDAGNAAASGINAAGDAAAGAMGKLAGLADVLQDSNFTAYTAGLTGAQKTFATAMKGKLNEKQLAAYFSGKTGDLSATDSRTLQSNKAELNAIYANYKKMYSLQEATKHAGSAASAKEAIQRVREEIERLNEVQPTSAAKLAQALRDIAKEGKQAGMSATAVSALQAEYKAAFDDSQARKRRIHRQQRIHMPRFQSVARHALPGVHFPERQRSRAKAGGWIGRAELPEPGPQMFQSRRDVRRLRDILGPTPGLLLDAGPELGHPAFLGVLHFGVTGKFLGLKSGRLADGDGIAHLGGAELFFIIPVNQPGHDGVGLENHQGFAGNDVRRQKFVLGHGKFSLNTAVLAGFGIGLRGQASGLFRRHPAAAPEIGGRIGVVRSVPSRRRPQDVVLEGGGLHELAQGFVKVGDAVRAVNVVSFAVAAHGFAVLDVKTALEKPLRQSRVHEFVRDVLRLGKTASDNGLMQLCERLLLLTLELVAFGGHGRNRILHGCGKTLLEGFFRGPVLGFQTGNRLRILLGAGNKRSRIFNIRQSRIPRLEIFQFLAALGRFFRQLRDLLGFGVRVIRAFRAVRANKNKQPVLLHIIAVLIFFERHTASFFASRHYSFGRGEPSPHFGHERSTDSQRGSAIRQNDGELRGNEGLTAIQRGEFSIFSIDINLFCTYCIFTKDADMHFVWNEEKATINLKKHGVSFEEAQTVFDDYYALRIFDPDHSESEDRFLLLGMSAALRMLVVCHCFRESDEQIRIISARKATKKENENYRRRK